LPSIGFAASKQYPNEGSVTALGTSQELMGW